MKHIIDLSDRKILITGASSGIGKAVAQLLSRVGAEVVLVARNEKRLQETVSLMEEPSRHFIFPFDLVNQEEIQTLVKSVVEADGRKIDGVVHSAGIGRTLPLQMIDYERQEQHMRINYYTFVELIRQVSKRKNCGDGCSIVGISSIASHDGGKCQTVYSGTKAAMDAAVTTLSRELADKGIRINSIRPGMIDTGMALDYAQQRGMDMKELNELYFFGLGHPDDVANLAAFLLSSAARFITGQHFNIDGGGVKQEHF